MAENRSTDPAASTEEASAALSSLEVRLDAARRAEADRMAREHAPLGGSGIAGGWQIASTMVGYPLGGIVIGFVLDQAFKTTPWIMIGMMFAAFAGGCLQVIRGNKTRAG